MTATGVEGGGFYFKLSLHFREALKGHKTNLPPQLSDLGQAKPLSLSQSEATRTNQVWP